MAITNGNVTVDTTAGGTTIFTPANGQKFGLMVQNNGSAAMTVGAGAVTAANGILIPAASGGVPGSAVFDEIDDILKGISASGSIDVRWLAWGKG